MKKSFVPPSVIKQKARQLKRDRYLSEHEARDQAAIFYGFSNHKNYLNEANANRRSRELAKELFSDSMWTDKKATITKMLTSVDTSFIDIKGRIQKLPRELMENRQDEMVIQKFCERHSDLHNYVETFFHKDFLRDEDVELQHEAPYHIPKQVFLQNLKYKFDAEVLKIEGDYTLKLEFAFDRNPGSEDEILKDREMHGSFEVSIDSANRISVDQQDTGFNS